MKMRAAVIGDAERIAALNAAGWRAGFRGLISDAYLATYDGLPGVRHETLAQPRDDDIQLVAMDGEQMIGWISGGRAHQDDLGPDAYEVRACYVEPAHWRTGVGRQLMTALIDRLEPSRWNQLALWTVRDAAPTNAFYESLGMVRDGREALLDRDGPVPLVRFSLLLNRKQTQRTDRDSPGRPDG
jgi:GNAT superfamily N-acetyltransferase